MTIDRYSQQIDPNWWKSKPVHRKILSVLYQPAYYLRLLRTSINNCLTYGSSTKSRYGLKEFVYDVYCQCAIAWRFGLDPVEWFSYRYEKKGWNKISKYSDIRLLQGWLNQSKANSEHLATCKDKVVFDRFCKRHDVPVVPTIGYFKEGEYTPVASDTGQHVLDQDLIVKHSTLKGGEEIRILSFSDGTYYEHEGASWIWEELRNDLAEASKRRNATILVQPSVHNHRHWQRFTSGGLATVRLLTGRFPTGRIEGLLASLRMPVGSSRIDNFSRGNLASPIDMETGQLGPAFTKYPQAIGSRFGIHPDTQELIKGATLAGWSRIYDCAIHLHENLMIPLLGLDVTLTQRGVRIVEANPYYGRAVLEIPHGKPLEETKFVDVVKAWMNASVNIGNGKVAS